MWCVFQLGARTALDHLSQRDALLPCYASVKTDSGSCTAMKRSLPVRLGPATLPPRSPPVAAKRALLAHVGNNYATGGSSHIAVTE